MDSMLWTVRLVLIVLKEYSIVPSSSGCKMEALGSSYEHVSELPGSVKGEEFQGSLSDSTTTRRGPCGSHNCLIVRMDKWTALLFKVGQSCGITCWPVSVWNVLFFLLPASPSV
jgi:hypothetical protein